MFKLNLEKEEETDQIANTQWIIEKAKEFQKPSTSVSLTMPKPLTVWIIINYGKLLKRWEYQTILTSLEKPLWGSRSNTNPVWNN